MIQSDTDTVKSSLSNQKKILRDHIIIITKKQTTCKINECVRSENNGGRESEQ